MEGKALFNGIARIFAFIWVILVMSLSGNMIHDSWNGESSSPNVVGYAMFCAAFGLLSLFYLIPATFKEGLAGHAAGPFVVDLLNTIFWFCGAVAFAAELTATSCTNYGFRLTNKITNSGPDTYKMCREGQAVTAFLWFGFAAFLVSTVLSGLSMGGSGFRRGGAARGPQMSKV